MRLTIVGCSGPGTEPEQPGSGGTGGTGVGTLEGIEFFENPFTREVGQPRAIVQDIDARP